MKKSLAAGLIGLTALGSGAVFAPSFASAQDDVTPEAVEQVVPDGEREGRRGHHGHHGRIGNSTVVTDILGLTAEELRAERQAGNSLADVAGADTQTVIDALVAEVNSRLDEKVADGSITAEEADERRANIVDRVTDKVNGVRPERTEGVGNRGPRGGGFGPAAGFGGVSADADTGVSA